MPENSELERRHQALRGCLAGCAVADAIGLPYEGLSPGRAERLLHEPDRHRLLFRYGMVSDDTEHAVMAAAAFVAARGDVGVFSRVLAKRLRWWLLAMPAGVGFATLRACIRLWCGIHPRRSGVSSAGNGPAMRAPVIGVLARTADELESFSEASSRLTHTDPRSLAGAWAIALEARRAASQLPPAPALTIASLEGSKHAAAISPMLDLLRKAALSAERSESTEEFAKLIGLERGVSGFIVHTTPVCLHACWRYPDDYEAAVKAVVRCGGDADTTAAIVGGVIGARVGVDGVPKAWRSALIDRRWVESWVDRLTSAKIHTHSVCITSLARLPRNIAFAIIVIAHGLRRLLPPY